MQEIKENKPFCALYLAVVILVVTNLAGSGCHQLSTNWMQAPFVSSAPQYESQYGPTPAQRVAGLQNLALDTHLLSQTEKNQAAQQLHEAYADEKDPAIRAEIIQTMGRLTASQNDAQLHAALSDVDPGVRMAACQAWAHRGGSEAATLLYQQLTKDSDPDVRRTAIQSLVQCPTTDTVSYLATALDDRDPALQVAAMDALRTVVGHDLGNNVNVWRQYAAGQTRTNSGSPVHPPEQAE